MGWKKFGAIFEALFNGLVPAADNPADSTKFLSQTGWVVPSGSIASMIGANILLVNPVTAPDSTPTPVVGVADFDFGGFTGGGSTEDTMTIPAIVGVDEGVFLISANIRIAPASITGGVQLRFVVTGASGGTYARVDGIVDTDLNAEVGLTTTFVIRMAEGDTVQAIVENDSGVSADITSAVFSISLLGKVPA